MANGKDSGENLRGLIMAEVSRQLGPLEAKVDRTHFAVERLYNTNGGPPGFLQTERAKDDERFEQIFAALSDLGPIKEFIRDHELLEKVRDRRFKRYIALWSLGAALFMAILALWDHRDAILHTLVDQPPAAHSQLSTIPESRQLNGR